MFTTTIRTLTRVRTAVYGNVAMGVVITVAGLIQASVALMYAGTFWTLSAAAALILTFLVDRGTAEVVFEGQVVDLQQPQLPDVRAHAAHMKIGSQGT